MAKIIYTYEKNIKKQGSTVRGENMYNVIDSKGKDIFPQRLNGLDYELATFYVDWINEENLKPAGMKEILEIIKEREI